jgi:DNA repair exonuclease SbcCD ATPase subunit
MRETFEDLRDSYLELRGKREGLMELLEEGEKLETELSGKYNDASKLRVIYQEIGEKTMNNLSFHVSTIVTSALAAVWPDPFGFEVEFTQARNTIECHMFFTKHEHRVKPIESSGGGALDVASFALRLTYWSLKPNRPCFILDEPFKYVSNDLQSACSEMVKMLSEKMGVQIIMISHLPHINISADKEYNVKLKGDISKVKEKK